MKLISLLFSILIIHSMALSATPPPPPTKVLVTGAGGKVGSRVVKCLREKGIEVRALVRKAETKIEGASEVIVGDILQTEGLTEAMTGCSACIACHGTARVAKLGDVFGRGRDDPDHPYHVNYEGNKSLVQAAKASGCHRLIRITGNAVGLPASSPVAILLNLFASMTVKWQLKGEQVLRASGLDYTVVRPGGLTDDPRPPGLPLVLTCDGQPASKKGSFRIGRDDVADLMVACLDRPNTKKATLSCLWGKTTTKKDVNPQYWALDWMSMLKLAEPDKSPLEDKPHLTSVR
ncbi:unnamed protein product [Chrysoparadoxa australica]